MSPSGVPLIPTQLFSSAGDFLLAFILIWYSNRSKKDGNTGFLYFILYGIGRFAVECFRADERGAIGPLSTSQFISIFMVIAAVILLFFRSKQEETNKNE
jgi:phosphatidylglycerol:prolipoprotein diacylglycerol transferase